MSHDDTTDEHPTTSAAAAPPPPPPPLAEQQQCKVKGIRKAKHLLRLPFSRSGKRSKRRAPPSPPPPPPPPPPYYDGEPRQGCYLCFLPPRSTPDSALQPTTGGTSGSKPPTYYNLLKSMIERNDFYSPECNVHREVQAQHPL